MRVLLPLVLIGLLLGISAAYFRSKSCNISDFSIENIIEHISYLSSETLEGRGLGTSGNELAIRYLVSELGEHGLSPIGEDGDYRQPFSVVSPIIDRFPTFLIRNTDGQILEEFEMYKDFRLLPSGKGKGLIYSGDLILVGSNIYTIDPEILNGKVVLIRSNTITDRNIDYALDQGCRGIFFSASEHWMAGGDRTSQEEKIIDASAKKGADLLIGTIGIDAYQRMEKIAGGKNLSSRNSPYAVIQGIELDVSIEFPVVETSNVLGYIPGQDTSKTLILSADIDGSGWGTEHRFFPGASNSAASIGILLEMARIFSAEQTKPSRNIVFAFWNSGHQSSAGMKRYLNNPLFPEDGTLLVHLDALGNDGLYDITSIAANDMAGNILGSKMARYAADSMHSATGTSQTGADVIVPFLRAGIPALSLSSFETRSDTYEDTSVNMTPEEIKAPSDILLNFIKRDIYRDVGIDYLSGRQIILFSFFAIWLLLAYLITAIFSVDPNGGIGNLRIDSIYYHPLSEFVRKGASVFLTISSVLFIIVFVVNLPRDGMILNLKGQLITNQSLYLSVKNTLRIITRVLSFGNEESLHRQELIQVLFPAFGRTLSLAATSMVLALLLGGISGVREAFGRRHLPGLASTGTLVAASMPDVAVAISGIWLYLAVARFFPELSNRLALRQFTIPMIVLAVLPGTYVSRICTISLRREMDREYVQLARAKGLNRAQILRYELMPVIVSTVIDTIPGLTAMMLTNLIVIEYMFAYKGIINYLLLFHTKGDAGAFVLGAVATGLIYTIFLAIGKTLSGLINPDRRLAR